MSYPLPVFLGFPCDLAGKEPICNVGDLDLIPGLGGSSGEGKGYPLQYSGLENSTDCIVHGVAKSQTQLSDFHFHFHLGIYLISLFLPLDHLRKKPVNCWCERPPLYLCVSTKVTLKVLKEKPRNLAALSSSGREFSASTCQTEFLSSSHPPSPASPFFCHTLVQANAVWGLEDSCRSSNPKVPSALELET